MSGSVRVDFVGCTDMGLVRSNNEDAYVVQNIWDKKHILAVAIDGVGGYEGGEVAAALAKESIVEFLNNNREGEKAELLKRAVIYANNTIYTERQRDAGRSQMSCVLTAVLVDVAEQYINMAHVGDTRLYQYCDAEFVKLSHDHSLVGYREEIGDLTEEEAMSHPQRNVISRDIGSRYLSEDECEYVEVNSFPLLPNSTLLLCSDGLCDMVTSVQMALILSEEAPLGLKVEHLIAAANAAGGRDNVTVVLVEYCADDDGLLGMPEESEIVSVGEDAVQPLEVIEQSTNKEVDKPSRKPLSMGVKILLASVAFFVVIFGAFFVGKHYDALFGGIGDESSSAVDSGVESSCDTLELSGPSETIDTDETGMEEMDISVPDDASENAFVGQP